MDKKQRRIALGAVRAKLRAEQGLSQVDVARALGQPQSFVSKCEAGQRRIDIQELEEIAKAIGVPLDRIVDDYREALG